MTVSETASYLGISPAAVRQRIKRGRVPTKRQGRAVVVDREALDREIGRS
jgi:excisionase family DNA binding protein